MSPHSESTLQREQGADAINWQFNLEADQKNAPTPSINHLRGRLCAIDVRLGRLTGEAMIAEDGFC